jgi:hypothetical protein
MRVGREGDLQMPRDMALRLGDDLLEYAVPFCIPIGGSILPGLHVGREGDIRPKVMAVGR